tara:strand:- start:48 stop:950 length:903 start_codon:yes stop_codon:yes gene_type:complete
MNHLELFSGTHSFGKVSSKLGYNVFSLDRDLGGECPFGSGYKSKQHIFADIMTWDYKQYPKDFFKIITASPVCLWWSNLRNTWIGRKLKSHGDKIITKELLEEDIENFGKPMVDKVFEIIDYFNPKYYIIENPQTGKMKNYINDLIPFYDVDYCKYSNWGYKKTTRFWTNIEGLEFEPCKNDCENIVTVKTEEGAIHTGYGTLIKSDTRTLHKTPIGDSKKSSNQKIHKKNMATSKKVIDNGIIINVNTAEKRTKYKDFENIMKNKNKHNKEVQDFGGGNNRLERYRIPEKVIEKLFKSI